MEVFAFCMECQKELGHPTFEPFIVPYYDDRLGPVECSRGHKSVLLLQSQKFEVLLESGANALTAGFTFEAAASFSTALERFYEFAVKVLLIHRQIDPAVYDAMFKVMARQSERQLGAFLALHALEFGFAYAFDEKITEFRNRAIHKGMIPTPEDARKFCARVHAEIVLLTGRLRDHCQAAMSTVIGLDLEHRRSLIPAETPVATTTGVTFFNLANADCSASFEDALKQHELAEKMFRRSFEEFRGVGFTKNG
jgi:hypothetical protein